MTINADTLTRLDEDEFADELNEHLGFNDTGWNAFLDHRVVRRTGEALEELTTKVETQIRAHEAETSEEHFVWERKAKNFKSLVDLRLRKARREIYLMEGSTEQRMKAWKAFAHELVDTIEDSDLNAELDEIVVPLGNLTARQWRDRRNEKRADAARSALDAGFGAEQYIVKAAA